MHFVLNDNNLTIIGGVLFQVIRSVDDDVLTIALEALHQVGFPLDDSWPARKFVENFIDDVVRGAVEEVLTLDAIP